jgi:hypothetical protein
MKLSNRDNKTQGNILICDSQQNDTHHDTRHNNLICYTQHNGIQHNITVFSAVMLSVRFFLL